MLLAWWTRWERIHMQCGRYGFDPWVGKIPLEEEMATHSSLLAGKTLRTEEPGGLLSMGPQRVEHDWACILANQPDAGWSQFISHSGLVHHISLEKVWLWKRANTGNVTEVLPLVVETQLWLWAWWCHLRLKDAHLSAWVIPGTGGAHSRQAQTTEREAWPSTLYCGKGRDKNKKTLPLRTETCLHTQSYVKEICSWALRF